MPKTQIFQPTIPLNSSDKRIQSFNALKETLGYVENVWAIEKLVISIITKAARYELLISQ